MTDAKIDWESFLAAATPLQWVEQVAAILAALALGYLFTRLLFRRVPGSSRWQFARHDAGRVVFAFFTLLLMGTAELVLRRFFEPVILVNTAKALLWALFVIRLAVFLLGQIIPEGAFLRLALRIIATVAWIGVVLHVTGLLPDVIDALDNIGFSLGKNKQKVSR